jgi:hypothetical protein
VVVASDNVVLPYEIVVEVREPVVNEISGGNSTIT